MEQKNWNLQQIRCSHIGGNFRRCHILHRKKVKRPDLFKGSLSVNAPCGKHSARGVGHVDDIPPLSLNWYRSPL